nr:MAG TPA: hypothetical protein [Bacteriophage sp.]
MIRNFLYNMYYYIELQEYDFLYQFLLNKPNTK